MRLAYVVSLFPKLSETFILRELIELERRGHDLTIISLKREREPLEHDEAVALLPRTLYASFGWRMAAPLLYYLTRRPGILAVIAWRVTVSHLSRPALMFRGLALIPVTLWFARQVRERHVEHLHAHWATWPALAAWMISELEGIPFSVTGHAHDLFGANPMLETKVRQSRFFATVSEFNRALLIQKCGPAALEKVRLIRCGLPMRQFAYRSRHDGGGAPLVVSVGRLVDYKGFDVLIRACGRLRDSGRPVSCLIVGEGPERAALEALIGRLRLESLVKLEGGRRQREVADRIARADLFVLACVAGRDGLQDGIPIVLMEAMALGVPVISTRLSGIPELVIDNRTGLLTSPGDDSHLASAMERLLSDPALADQLRKQGREFVEKEFDLDRSVSQLCAEFARSSS